MSQAGIPKAAVVSISDMIDHCAKIKAGQEVLILAHTDGLNGGDNLIDANAIGWIETLVKARGANVSVLWVDEVPKVHEWRFPPVVKAAMAGCDVLINTSFNMAVEEIAEFRNYIAEKKIWMVRVMATTADLLCSEWAQTPHELVSEIRFQSSKPFTHLAPWVMTDPNGTHLEGLILDPVQRPGIPGMAYNSRRADVGYYLPWPEWVHPPVNLKETNGVFVFNCMLGWWSRYIGIQPYWNTPIEVKVENNRIKEITGGEEADKLKAFLKVMAEKAGDGMYNFDTFHFGVHPNAKIEPYQCPHTLYRRLVEHSNTCDLHVHIGSAPSNPNYPYWPHITGDIRHATLKVGDKLVYDNGYLCCLEDPEVLKVAAKYPGRPGVPPRA